MKKKCGFDINEYVDKFPNSLDSKSGLTKTSSNLSDTDGILESFSERKKSLKQNMRY